MQVYKPHNMSNKRKFADGESISKNDVDESVIQFDRFWFENHNSKSFGQTLNDLSISQGALAEWFESSMRQGGDAQTYAQFAVENLRHISESQYVDALLRSARDAINPYEIQSQVVLIVGRTDPGIIWAALMVWKQIRQVVTSVVFHEDLLVLENIDPKKTTALFVNDVYWNEDMSSIDIDWFVQAGGAFRYICGAYIDIYEDKEKFGKALRIKSVATLLKDSLILKNDQEARRILERFGKYSPLLDEGFTFFDHFVPHNIRDLLLFAPQIDTETGRVQTHSLFKNFKSPRKYKFSSENGHFKFEYRPQEIRDLEANFRFEFKGVPIDNLDVVFGKTDSSKEITQDESSETSQSGSESENESEREQ